MVDTAGVLELTVHLLDFSRTKVFVVGVGGKEEGGLVASGRFFKRSITSKNSGTSGNWDPTSVESPFLPPISARRSKNRKGRSTQTLSIVSVCDVL